MVDHLDAIESDLSRFHRIDDPMAIDSPRFFKLVAYLPHYGGVIANIAQMEAQREESLAAPQQEPARRQTATKQVDDVRQLEAMTKSPGGGFQFPELEIVGG